MADWGVLGPQMGSRTVPSGGFPCGFNTVGHLLNLLQGLQRESKDYEKDHYKNKTRKPNNTKMSSLVSVTISLKQIRRLPGARRSHFDVCFPGYNGGQAVPQHLDTASAN